MTYGGHCGYCGGCDYCLELQEHYWRTGENAEERAARERAEWIEGLARDAH